MAWFTLASASDRRMAFASCQWYSGIESPGMVSSLGVVSSVRGCSGVSGFESSLEHDVASVMLLVSMSRASICLVFIFFII